MRLCCKTKAEKESVAQKAVCKQHSKPQHLGRDSNPRSSVYIRAPMLKVKCFQKLSMHTYNYCAAPPGIFLGLLKIIFLSVFSGF
jgi:hypothetical protein